MLDWMTRKPEKTEYERLTEAYQEKFGKPWIERIGFNKSIEDTMTEIEKCISDGTEQKIPKYKKRMIY